MLFPIVLLGAVWADLNRPTTKSELNRFEREWDRREEAWDHGQQAPQPGLSDRTWSAYQLIRGRALAARVQEGMTEKDVRRIFGAAEGQTGFIRDGAGGRRVHLYCPIGVCISYRQKSPRADGKDRREYRVVEVQPTAFSTIADFFVPDRPRHR
jgi:hypothetical protein